MEKGVVYLTSLFSLKGLYALTPLILDCMPEEKNEGLIQTIIEETAKERAKEGEVTAEEVLAVLLEFNRVNPVWKIIEKHVLVARALHF